MVPAEASASLPDKDRQAPKTMNTHLHVLEAYANLYHCWSDARLAQSLRGLLATFLIHILDAPAGHLRLFFTEDWMPVADLVSYGHDIEAAWLLLETAMIINDQKMIDLFKPISMKLAKAGRKGLDEDGGLWYEYVPFPNLRRLGVCGNEPSEFVHQKCR